MDLYSTARRLTRPFEHGGEGDERSLPVGSRGIIGDGFTAALVREDGVIDWLCLPRFDSPSVFGGLLDPERGGSTGLFPVAKLYDSLQRYDPDTNVLETLFNVPGQGVVRLTDYMPWTDDPRLSVHEIHRRVECTEGAVEMAVVFDPRFDYGQSETRIERQEHGLVAMGAGGERLVAVLGGECSWRERGAGGVETRIALSSGESRWMVLGWNAPRAEPIEAYRTYETLRATRHRWREWAGQLRYGGPYRHHVMRSALLLKLLMYAPTGAMVAAPTTSLPEWIGGRRNWDYRYTWTRDSAMAIRAANMLGFTREARDFFHFVRDTLERDETLQVMYSVDGSPVPDERELTGLRGFRGTGPVRVGNGARDQLQLDTAGALMDAALVYERAGGSITLRAWRQMRDVVADVERRWSAPDHGIWEPRAGKRHNVHSRLMSWLALRRGAELAPLFGDGALAARWAEEAAAVHREVTDRGLDPRGDHFVAAYDHEHADASLLLLPIHRFLPAEDPRILRTVQWVRDELGSGPYVYRYRADDGVGGEEGAFVLCGFWLAEALAMAGQVEEAQEVFVAHAEASNHLGLLSEEIDPASGRLLGNFPQAFSHLGLVNAAARIDLALRRRDGQSVAEPWMVLERS